MSIPSTGTGKRGPLDGRFTVTIREACEATGLSRVTIWRLRNDRKLRSVSVGKRKLIDVQSLLDLVTAA
jgi:excisionase family DNA binding protein